jgi:hypothetical protein
LHAPHPDERNEAEDQSIPDSQRQHRNLLLTIGIRSIVDTRVALAIAVKVGILRGKQREQRVRAKTETRHAFGMRTLQHSRRGSCSGRASSRNRICSTPRCTRKTCNEETTKLSSACHNGSKEKSAHTPVDRMAVTVAATRIRGATRTHRAGRAAPIAWQTEESQLVNNKRVKQVTASHTHQRRSRCTCWTAASQSACISARNTTTQGTEMAIQPKARAWQARARIVRSLAGCRDDSRTSWKARRNRQGISSPCARTLAQIGSDKTHENGLESKQARETCVAIGVGAGAGVLVPDARCAVSRTICIVAQSAATEWRGRLRVADIEGTGIGLVLTMRTCKHNKQAQTWA